MFALLGLGLPEIILVALLGIAILAVPVTVVVVLLVLRKSDEKRKDAPGDVD